ncbi:MAG TPA: hypothetical protein VIV11_10535 [Kofleriaceae bacterium]
MTEQKQDGVVELTGAGVPADQGLSSLGMLMQLGGNMFAALAGFVAFMTLLAPGMRDETLWMIVLIGASITRSLFHRNAGSQLLYGAHSITTEGSNQRLAGIRRYIGVAILQTLLTGAMLGGKFHMEAKMVLGIVLGLAVWPVTLAILMALPRFRRFKDDLPLSEDKGFESASILMTVLGVSGAIFSGWLLFLMLDLPGKAMTKGPGVLIVLSLALLVVRSVLHVQAGMSGLRETSVDRSVELANRYANFGVISSFCAGGAMLMGMMTLQMSVIGLAAICALCWVLMSWPLIIRRFYSDRQFADLLAGTDAPIHRRAPDAGLTGLGWLLIALAAYSASFLVPQLVFPDFGGRGKLDSLMSLGGGFGFRSVWFSVGLVVLQAWAGFELVRMSPQARIIATVFGVVGAIVTVYINWPILQMFKGGRGMPGVEESMLLPALALALIVPISTLVLVNRKIAPTARARFRQKPQATPPTSPA